MSIIYISQRQDRHAMHHTLESHWTTRDTVTRPGRIPELATHLATLKRSTPYGLCHNHDLLGKFPHITHSPALFISVTH
jgi:hypothetical protein